MVTSGAEGALFSSCTAESDCFWIGTTTFACFLGRSGVIGRALSMGLSAIVKERLIDRETERQIGIKRFNLKGWSEWGSDSKREKYTNFAFQVTKLVVVV
jgi:hypothetical protein